MTSQFWVWKGTKGSWWVWQADGTRPIGPFPTQEAALTTSWYLEDGLAECEGAEPTEPDAGNI